MAEERDTYEATRARLEEIAASVRKKDVSLEKSIELLEEGVRLANLCTEQVDQVELVAAGSDSGSEAVAGGSASAAQKEPDAGETAEPAAAESVTAADEVDDDPLAEAFADVEADVEREAGEGQTEAFGD
jgi:exodeoxyribonuclease VII small subunit